MAEDSVIKKILTGLGLSGSTIGTNSLLNPARTPGGLAKLQADFTDAGSVADPNLMHTFQGMLANSITYEQCLNTWEEMAGWDLITSALTEIVDETLQTGANDPATLWYECSDTETEKELNEMLENILDNGVLESQVWYTAALGNHFEKINYAKGDGVTGLAFVHPTAMRRYWLQRTRRCIGFRWENHAPDKSDLSDTAFSEISPVAMDSGSGKEENLWYPWDFMHIRRMYRTRANEHGEAIFGEAQGIYKKLRMALDQMVVHRAQVQPDRYVIGIDTGEQPPAEQMRTTQRWKQLFRKKISYGEGGQNNQPSDFKSYYNPLALDTVLWLPQTKGSNHTITKLNGTASVPDVYDIEMLTSLFFSIIGMPKQWITGTQGDSNGNPMSGKALLAQDIRFLRKIKAIRRPIKEAYKWLGYFHLLLKGKSIDNVAIRVMMSNISSLEEQQRMETLKLQVEVISSLADVMDKFKLPRAEWVEIVFKQYMRLPDSVVNSFITALPIEDVEVQESIQKKVNRSPAPRRVTLIRMLESELQKQGYNARTLRDTFMSLESESKKFYPREQKPLKTKDFLLEKSLFVPGDMIQSSFGNVESSIDPKLPTVMKEPLQESATPAGGFPKEFML